MSQENVEVVLGAYEAFAQGDLTAVLARFDPTVVSYTAPPLPDPVEHQGHDGFLEWVENWTGAFDEFVIDVKDHIDAGEEVVVRVVQRATGVASGVPVEQTSGLCTFSETARSPGSGFMPAKARPSKPPGSRSRRCRRRTWRSCSTTTP